MSLAGNRARRAGAVGYPDSKPGLIRSPVRPPLNDDLRSVPRAQAKRRSASRPVPVFRGVCVPFLRSTLLGVSACVRFGPWNGVFVASGTISSTGTLSPVAPKTPFMHTSALWHRLGPAHMQDGRGGYGHSGACPGHARHLGLLVTAASLRGGARIDVHFASISAVAIWPLLACYGRFFVLGRPGLRLAPTRWEWFDSLTRTFMTLRTFTARRGRSPAEPVHRTLG